MGNESDRSFWNSIRHRKYVLILAVLLMIHGGSVAGVTAGITESPFPIHYGPNDSHGRSWVRQNSDGVIGITYFQHDEGSYDEGTLIYKTILPNGSQDLDTLTTGTRLEKSVLLYDASNEPHIFVARSNESDQVIDHYAKNGGGEWQSETILHFYNEGGKFIYELSADTGPDHSFHLLILKSRSDVDSDDFMDAWINSYLYHLTNASGSWVKELVHNYDMAYTYDMCFKSSIRQDIKVDNDGFVHVAFSEQLSGSYDPSRLRYATNRSGAWVVETALNNDFGLVDDAGWYPSLCLDNDGTPYIACIYLNRVMTHSIMYSKLLLLKRLGADNWNPETIAEYDDGYYGADGRDYTGALCHLVFDNDNTPHIIFSDIAAFHWTWQQENVGNIRYGVFEDGAWNITTVYRQPLPTGFYSAVEMLWMCLVVSEQTGKIHVIGQEIDVVAEGQYTCQLVELAWSITSTSVLEDPESLIPERPRLSQNHPNPFNAGTSIEFDLPRGSEVTVAIHNILGQQIDVLVTDQLLPGSHSLRWDGTDCRGKPVPTGVYFYRLQAGDFTETKKMLLLK